MMRKIIFGLFGLLAFASMHAQNWSHVGPLSTNLQPVNGMPNLFETAQINLIEVNPWNVNHLVCGGRYAGFWESLDGGESWKHFPTQHLGSNGVGSLHFLSKQEVLVTHLHFIIGGVKKTYSKGIGIYNSAEKSWRKLPDLPYSDYIIYDANSYEIDGKLEILLGTSQGLHAWDETVKNWMALTNDPVHSVKINKVENRLEPLVVISGTQRSTGQPQVTMIDFGTKNRHNNPKMVRLALPVYRDEIMRDGMTTIVKSTNLDCIVEFGAIRSVDDFDVYLLSDQEISYREKSKPDSKTKETNHLMLYKTRFKDGNFGDAIVLHNETSVNGLTGGRTGLVYDSWNTAIYFSGVKLNCAFDPDAQELSERAKRTQYRIRSGFKTGTDRGTIHDDIHELRIFQKDGRSYLIAACDGGIAMSELKNHDWGGYNLDQALHFHGLNNGLHVMLVNGFSGASKDPNFYAVGGFDIINTDFFRADLGRNEHTESTWENAGALIDQFDNSRVIIDVSLYNQFYRVVNIDSARNYTVSPNRSFYLPSNPGQAPIRANPSQLSNSHNEVIGFQPRNFVQDPYRPGRIFYVKHKVGLHQFDFESGLFVRKLDLAEMNPETEWAGWSNDWRWWRSVSFSPQTPNSMHIIINGSDNPENRIWNPMVIKYIGNDLDACFGLDHTRFGTNGSPQWKLISEKLFNRFNRTMGTALSQEQIHEINLIDIATSPQNKNRVYVMMRSKDDSNVKIVMYTGSRWVNYGIGLPKDEYAMAMVLDYKTKDGIYLATDKNIYYRELGMKEWICVTGNFPMLNVEQLEINYVDNTLRAGTFGLGIWKMPLYLKN